MKNYIKPMVLSNEELAEGVFAGSGVVDNGCYTVTPRPHQFTQDGRADYRFQFDAVHSADHSCDTQNLIINFDRSVTYVSSNGKPVTSSGNTIVIEYHYHNNASDNIGLGDVVVNSDGEPIILSVKMTDIAN